MKERPEGNEWKNRLCFLPLLFLRLIQGLAPLRITQKEKQNKAIKLQ
jgi:hypothetical protein